MLTAAELHALVALCRNDRKDVAQRAFALLVGEFERLINAQHYSNYRAFCDLVFALDYPLFWSALCEIVHK